MAKAENARSTVRETRTRHAGDGESTTDDEVTFYVSLFRPELTDEEVRRVWRNSP